MASLQEFTEAVSNVVHAANELSNEISAEIYRQSPITIHQRFCHELVEVMRHNPNKNPCEVPKAMKILDGISMLEEFYPDLIKK